MGRFSYLTEKRHFLGDRFKLVLLKNFKNHLIEKDGLLETDFVKIEPFIKK